MCVQLAVLKLLKSNENLALSEEYFGKKWKNHIRVLDQRTNYCVCCFLKQVYVIGGVNTKSCLKYDLNAEQWTNLANTSETRNVSACTFLKEKLL